MNQCSASSSEVQCSAVQPVRRVSPGISSAVKCSAVKCSAPGFAAPPPATPGPSDNLLPVRRVRESRSCNCGDLSQPLSVSAGLLTVGDRDAGAPVTLSHPHLARCLATEEILRWSLAVTRTAGHGTAGLAGLAGLGTCSGRFLAEQRPRAPRRSAPGRRGG